MLHSLGENPDDLMDIFVPQFHESDKMLPEVQWDYKS